MLSYPISKDLQRRGYPQELKVGGWYYERDGSALVFLVRRGSYNPWNQDYVKVPTTDGMMDGLGRSFVGLQQDQDGSFWASGLDSVSALFAKTKETPELALAELWRKVKPVKDDGGKDVR